MADNDFDAALKATEEQYDKAHPAEVRHHPRTSGDFLQDWPDAVLNPPGLVGEVARFIRDASGMEQPKFALAASLTVCGALVGRGVRDYTGQMTNLYTLAVGGTSAGKNDPMRAVFAITRALGAKKLLAGELTSDSALEWLIEAFPVRLLLLDEVGQYLTCVKGAGQSNGYLRTVIPALTKCWSAATSALLGKSRGRDPNDHGKWKPPVQTEGPCVSLYGTSAPDVLFDAMTEADFADGSIPRFIVFISRSRPMFVAKPAIAVPDALKEKLRDALTKLGVPPHGAVSQDGTSADIPKPMLVDYAEDAGCVFDALEREKLFHMERADAGDKVLYLYGKIVENARRVALTVAALRNPAEPVVEASDAEYGCALMRHAVRDMVATVRSCVASNKTERTKQRLLLAIRAAGEGGITQSDLTRATRSLKCSERDEALQDLVDAEEVELREEAGTGAKKVRRYLYLG